MLNSTGKDAGIVRGGTASDALFIAGLNTLTVSSSAFAANGEIPSAHTRYGDDRSPPLAWSGAPAGTKSFAIIVDDPDAPRVWVHWIAWNIPAGTTNLAAGVAADDPTLRQGANDYGGAGGLGYGGPQPPSGTHHYRFHLVALSSMLDLSAGANESALLGAMRGKVLAWGMLVGTCRAP
ncbi:MAG: YbhB/YbcL family Raf kinase inhibitor-like protein [Planctomycetota bacterium]